ncbi:hypothetical protein DEO72_LG4g1474 [Vigna unguiculata]|uniref:Uncharacterized protein n=1 Tax=Vigna unguiculata TaxID=3917 RepID=A0A4D6LQ51_VIGUN|nr:hypothetical protein DEO72_LG4g1474 [Vigna unguiculata]
MEECFGGSSKFFRLGLQRRQQSLKWLFTCVNRTEFEMVEEIANDVLQKLNRANVSDLDAQIAKLEQLAKLQGEFYQKIISVENLQNQRATVQRVIELKMERNMRLLRLTPDLLSHMQRSNSDDSYGGVFGNTFF